MYNQLLLPVNFVEPTDFSVIEKNSLNELAISWLQIWPIKYKKIQFSCLIGCQALLLLSVWSHINNAKALPSDERLFYDCYKMMHNKDCNKCYTLASPELIKNEYQLLCIFNLIKESNSYLLLISEIHPSNWYIELPDLKSRISMINVIAC